MDWGVINASAIQAEQAEGPYGRRVTKVLCSTEGYPNLWHGLFSCAPVEYGPDGYVLSDGQVITV